MSTVVAAPLASREAGRPRGRVALMSPEVPADFEAFVADHRLVLRRYALALTGRPDAADDLLQETLVRLYLAWNRMEHHDAVGAYARTIMSRQYITWWRRWGRREFATDTLPETPVAPDESVGDRQVLWRAMQGLGRRQRAVVALRYFHDLDERSIAETLGISVGTVKSQLSRALATLRTTLEGGRP